MHTVAVLRNWEAEIGAGSYVAARVEEAVVRGHQRSTQLQTDSGKEAIQAREGVLADRMP